MTRDQLKALLNAHADIEFIDRQIFNRCPWIFDADTTFDAWRKMVATELELDPRNIRIVGSAATGYSLSPLKAGRPFRKAPQPNGRSSDIDIALVDPSLFAAAWDAIVSLDRQRSWGASQNARDKVRLDIYWGLVGQQNIPRNTAPTRKLLTAMAIAGQSPPLRGYVIRCRVYRRMDDLRAYHIASLRLLRAELN